MADDGFEFVWGAPKVPLKWATTAVVDAVGKRLAANVRVLTTGVPIGAAAGVRDPERIARTYAPLGDATLLQDFAELEPTEAAILRFATRYGPLYADVQMIELPGGEVGNGEPLESWQKEHAAFHLAVHDWQTLAA